MFSNIKKNLGRIERALIVITAVATLVAWATFSSLAAGTVDKLQMAAAETEQSTTAATNPATATFGSGCFWCTESDFDKVPGVISTISGYMGGKPETANYRTVSSGTTEHAEVLQVSYDPKKVSYKELLNHYWHTTDVVDGTGQFCDRGPQYRPVIFAHTDEQLKFAQNEKMALEQSKRFDRPIAVKIQPVGALKFTAAEHYHQDFYRKYPLRYKYYRYACGRDARLKSLWGELFTN
jgi:methionine-S-sulfoxide reductase